MNRSLIRWPPARRCHPRPRPLLRDRLLRRSRQPRRALFPLHLLQFGLKYCKLITVQRASFLTYLVELVPLDVLLDGALDRLRDCLDDLSLEGGIPRQGNTVCDRIEQGRSHVGFFFGG